MSNDDTVAGQSADPHLLVGAYALDAVDDIERARFERHLAGCGDCQDELFGLLETSARLGGAEFAEPPASMRADVMDRVARTPQVVPAGGGPGATVRRSPAAVRWLSAAACAGLVAAAGLGAVAYSQNQQADANFAAAQAAQEQAAQVASIMTAPDAQLSSMKMPGEATSTIVTSALQGKAALVAQNVPAAPPGQVYELWTLSVAGAATPAGTWTPNADGTASVVLSGDVNAAKAVAVTVEPAGGSQQPTTKPIAHVVI